MKTYIALETQVQRYPETRSSLDGYSHGTFFLGLRSGRHAHAPAFSLIRRKPKIKNTRSNKVLRLEMARLKYGEIVWRDLRCSSNTAGTVVIYFGNSIMLDTPSQVDDIR